MKKLYIGLATMVVVVVVGYATFPHVFAFFHELHARRTSFTNLRQASSEEELQNAVGDLGLFISLPESQWIAICYRDSHIPKLWSVSTVRDSGGQWWTSDKHFCAQLQGFDRAYRDREADPDTYSKRLRDYPDLQGLDRIANSKTLDEARKGMMELGFTRSPELEQRAATFE